MDAEAVREKALKDSNTSLPDSVQVRMMREAQSRIDAAEASLKAVKRRCKLISEFMGATSKYYKIKENIRIQGVRLQWIREQMPPLEAELKEAQVSEGSSSARTNKRTLGDDGGDGGDDKAQERSAKKKKRHHQAGSPSRDSSSLTQA
ncbi:uncharacterized protein MAM_06032 [Metarhizium album ARSEF 1941]|uniref:Uncharacterized protein n=1 Tax=Metarhizium album (strain ARSEF 1941) TaxID=1081103 RepID=A0A0B2WRE7_METAS|nr:uncharacterized protein MAM_06032 [Metarhizium album ARSEF 1941]KHN96184.1 hypothetical protein MAM_06032 [Metarhizium album ARSEF 1941]